MRKTIIVDKEHPITDGYYKYTKFVNTKNTQGKEILVEQETYEHYLQLNKFLKDKGIEIDIARGHLLQEKYERTDDMNTGLSLVIDCNADISKYLTDFGFIKRFPKKNNYIRYTGKFIAKRLEESKMTLEDYVENYSALIVARKEYGMTSYDVVQEISQLFGIKRVGHTGTLDPMAEGVLIIAIGKATKIVELLTAKEKEYIAKVKLGIRTDTRDTEGNIIEEKEVPDNLPIEEVLKSFKKTYLQEVPIYSAVKVKGKKLYEYSREEKEVELPKKEVTIKEIKLLEKNKDTFSFQTLVSKGTYIRSLIDDIGLSLGTFATMTNLIRTKQGKVTLEDASTLDQIRNYQFKIYRIEDVLEYPKIEIEETYLKAIRNGQRLDNIWNIKDKVMFTYKKKLLGIYEVDGTELKVWKNF